MNKRQFLLIIAIALLWVGGFGAITLIYPSALTWDRIELLAQEFEISFREQPWIFTFIYFIVYVFVNMFSIPIATLLALCAGALYGNFWATVLLSIAGDIGGCGTFLVARFLLRQTFERRLSDRLLALHKSWQGDGVWILFSLRLQPIFPYVLVNILFGLTQMPLGRFAFWSLFALIPNTFLMVNTGQQLSVIRCPQDIYRWELVLSLALLAIFPWLIKKLLHKKVFCP